VADGPVYANLLLSFLSNEYDKLPQYFEWRRAFINNTDADPPQPASIQFLLLYAAEMLYVIEQPSPLAALESLARLISSYRNAPKNIRNRLKRWMRDFYVLHSNCDPPRKVKNTQIDVRKPDRFDFPFSYFMYEKKLAWLYPEYVIGSEFDNLIARQMSADDIFDIYAELSSYDIKASRIVKEGYGNAARDAFIQTWSAVAMRIIEGGQDISSVFVDSRPVGSWNIYPKLEVRRNSLYSSMFMSNRRFNLHIDAHRKPEPFERFRFRGRYMAQITEAKLNVDVGLFFGDIMKRIDRELREAVKFPSSLSIPEDRFKLYFKEMAECGSKYVSRTALHGIDIPKIISDSVKKVIRLLPEDLREYKKQSKGRKGGNASLPEARLERVKVSIDFTKLTDVREEAAWVFGRLTEGQQVDEEIAPALDDYSATVEADESVDAYGWDKLAAALDDTTKRILCLMASARNVEALDAVRRAGYMTETFAERVNEAALSAVGDILIETDGNGISLIGDYMEEVRKAL